MRQLMVSIALGVMVIALGFAYFGGHYAYPYWFGNADYYDSVGLR
jgi:hypothetical protein